MNLAVDHVARKLDAFVNEHPVGVLSEEGDVWAFTYDIGWVRHARGFALSPALPLQDAPLVDGASHRPVQWYFDNLLPEEGLRVIYAREAQLAGEDSFGLLAHFGAESAGSLTLRVPGTSPAEPGRRELADAALSTRIRNLPRVPLIHDAPKHMSLAGAQHKMLVVISEDRLYEPMGGEVSTHILKPDHPDVNYPNSVINEYFVMRLAHAAGIPVPAVHRRYVPEAVYLVERFDRVRTGNIVVRRHAIDSCQLLNRPRSFKYAAANLASLAAIARACRGPAAATLWLYRWLVFNLLVGNADNHLKNISALVDHAGIELAPAYDLLSTAVYETRACSEEPAWPAVELVLPLPGAAQFGAVRREHVLRAASDLGVPGSIAIRELDRLIGAVARASKNLICDIERDNDALPEAARVASTGELRLLRAIEAVVIRDMCARLA